MSQKSLVPPRFAIAASEFLYDTDLPDHLYRTYARITGLAWQKRQGSDTRYERTPPLTVYELAVICGLSVRNMWRQIDELVKRGLLAWETEMAVQKRMVFYPIWPDGASEATRPFGVGHEDAEAAEATGEAAEATGEPASAGPPDETGQALAEFGVDLRESLARQVAALPHVTPELVRAWGSSLQQRPGIHNLPGLLLHILQRTAEPPAESNPGPHPPQPPSSPEPMQVALLEPATAPAGNAESLPDDLRQALQDLGWSGDDAWAEVAGIAAGGPPNGSGRGLDFVWAWVRYVEDHPNLGAGFLRSRLRGTTWPAHKKDPEERKRERWLEQWQEQDELDPPSRRLPSPREQAMERYSIAPETMDSWKKALEELALQMTRATFDTWLRGSLLLSVENGRATLGVRHAYSGDWLQNRLDKVILRTLGRHLDREVEELHVVVLNAVEGREDP